MGNGLRREADIIATGDTGTAGGPADGEIGTAREIGGSAIAKQAARDFASGGHAIGRWVKAIVSRA